MRVASNALRPKPTIRVIGSRGTLLVNPPLTEMARQWLRTTAVTAEDRVSRRERLLISVRWSVSQMKRSGPSVLPRLGEFAAVAAISSALAFQCVEPFQRFLVVDLIRSVAESHGLKPDEFIRMAEIESGLDPDAYNPRSRAAGLFQFIPSTARQYKLERSFDAHANANAAAALWLDNAKVLKAGLGRQPSSAELYLAHQQGARGAIGLLTNPDRPAADIVGRKAVTMNGGAEDMTAATFAGMWIDRFQRN